MSKLMVSLSVTKNYNWFSFKNISIIEKDDLNILKQLNPYFMFCELTGNHDNLEFYFNDLDVEIVSSDVKEIEYLENLGVADAGIKKFDLIKNLNSNYPQWRDGVFDEHYNKNYAGFKNIQEYYSKRNY